MLTQTDRRETLRLPFTTEAICRIQTESTKEGQGSASYGGAVRDLSIESMFILSAAKAGYQQKLYRLICSKRRQQYSGNQGCWWYGIPTGSGWICSRIYPSTGMVCLGTHLFQSNEGKKYNGERLNAFSVDQLVHLKDRE